MPSTGMQRKSLVFQLPMSSLNQSAMVSLALLKAVSPEVIGITDPLATQVRYAAYQVGAGEISVDEAVSKYGSFGK